MADDSLERRMDELRSMGLTEQQIVDLVNKEIQRTIAQRRAAIEQEPNDPATHDSAGRTSSTEQVIRSESNTLAKPEDGGTAIRAETDDTNDDGPSETRLHRRMSGQAQVRKVLALLHQRQSMTFSGPLPPPEWAMQYERQLPGFLDRQVRLQERKADLEDREMDLAERMIASQDSVRKRGQWLATAVAFGFLILAAFIGASNPWAGAAIAMLDVSALTAAFVIGRHIRSKRRALPEADEDETDHGAGSEGEDDKDFD